LLAKTLLVRLPSRRLVPLTLLDDLLVGVALPSTVDSPSDNDDIAPTFPDDLVRCTVLLSHPVALAVESNTRRHDNVVGSLSDRNPASRRLKLVNPLHRDETHDEFGVPPRGLDVLRGVLTGGKVTGGAHLGEEEETASERLTDGGETGKDTLSGYEVGVGDVRPRGDLVDARGVLESDGVAYRIVKRSVQRKKGEKRKKSAPMSANLRSSQMRKSCFSASA
jgi:hypothetical protein